MNAARTLAIVAGTTVAMSAAALGDCHHAGGISVTHHDGSHWCVGGFYDGQQIFTF
ncbi:MAG: hypothetical protein J2P17_15655 [Mycobacterium sp.]|nr:hypothetical protein [Mycobacterium sp.]